MNEAPIEQADAPPAAQPTSSPSRLRWGRLGCGLLLVGWFVCLLTPCLAIALAVRGEIVLPRSDLPGDQIRIWLISEADSRGIGISISYLASGSPPAGEFCMATDVRFILWKGEGSAGSYTECFARGPDGWVVDGAS